MKKVLLKAFLLTTSLILLLLPFTGSAQCSCSGGLPANQEEHLVVLAPTNQSNTTISFPKFDPAVGTLNCVTLHDTISIVSSTGIRNYDAIATEYEFQLTVNTKIEGPSLTRTNFKNLQYGPDILDAFGSITDSINYGPDTIYNRHPSARTNTTDMTPYLGPGTVNFAYTIGGGVIAVGGANYNSQVRTTTWGIFKLTYYWCTNAVLASSVRNLAVSRSGEVVELNWQGPENSKQENFKIETSTDGKEFTDLEQPAGTNIIGGSSAEYKFKYRSYQRIDRKTYFRIRYEHNQKVSYSETKWLLADDGATSTLSVYPNPAFKNVRLQLKDAVSGELNIELSNQVGQVIVKRKVWMNGTNYVDVLLNDSPNPGIYFVKARQPGSSKVYSGKLLFKR